MNLATRLFITFALLIAFAVGSAIGLTYWLGHTAVDKQIDNTFITSQSVQRYFLEQELRELELVSELVAADRAFVAYVVQSLNVGADQQIDTRSITDLLNERSAEYGFDFSLILSPDGHVQVETGDLVTIGSDLSSRQAISSSLESRLTASGLWVTPERVLQVAATPLISGRTIQGYLITGNAVSNEFMGTIARVSGIELAYVALTDERPNVVTTTLQVIESEGLSTLLSSDATLQQDISTEQLIGPIEIELSGQEWIANITPAGGNQASGLLVSLVPKAQLFKTFRDISNVFLIAGMISILLALIVSVTASRRILKPLESLTNLAEDATRGQYRRYINVSDSGELLRLQRAFNRLISDQREQQAAAAYFDELLQKQSVNQWTSGASRLRDDTDTLQTLPQGMLLGNRYEILKMVGKGGMGIVYEAIDRELREVVALKVMQAELVKDSEKVSHLKDEIRLARRITHPNVVRTFDFVQIDGIPMISMEFVRGISLEDAIRHYGQGNYYACLHLALQICNGVSAAHKAGVLHRDIKPGNVMITHIAKVMDFGIAYSSLDHSGKQTEKSSFSEQTFAGTPSYLSPEQLRGEEVDERSDIYSLGILFTEMFTGKVPIESTDTKEIFKSHLSTKLILPSAFWPEIPLRLEAIILQCLEKAPKDRWQSVEQLHEALDEFRLIT